MYVKHHKGFVGDFLIKMELWSAFQSVLRQEAVDSLTSQMTWPKQQQKQQPQFIIKAAVPKIILVLIF